ncbi:hnh endonuclease [Leptolyngbya sp. Heron Island J]|uniref:hypothetical protein n=1 Tax=Leptolyngbya sp. Heron Island J TaxID=1385935 RepID=UPI0003B9ECFC|nr:hypothetical protein [Leptolyngbya sp. Heron Island J]ESA37380.1 hnh endonuclease [Leptolyngbya sp. Heron Island J]
MSNTLETLELLDFYGKKFQKIRVDRAHGVAPHKPILLLSVIEHIQKQLIQENKIFLQPQLIQTFLKYWVYLGSDTHNPDISKPFFFMKSGKFWHLWPNPKYKTVLSSKVKLKTFAEVKRAIKFAYLDEDLFDLLQQRVTRDNLSRVLVSKWFPGKWSRVEEIMRINQIDGELSLLVQKHSLFYPQKEVW